ncbi:MAG: three component ABC system middle component [Terriglobia bacterium]
MQAWTERPTEIAHLLNPAFCALILVHSVRGFIEETAAGLPYPLAFLVLPVVLHKPTREALPASIATKMHPWLENHQEVQVGFADRCASVVGHTREAIVFAVARNLLRISNDARIEAPEQRLRRPRWPSDSEPAVCLDKARFVGRWMANAGQTATLYAMWGIRP